ncbi:hypothetical protein BJF84_15415 [Rhodococcus sp. CUA-806]|nr:hypothetical protein BJF84_15415 [Rhodococcus sp. CUA-806]
MEGLHPPGERSIPMATASMPDLTGLDKTAQLDALRRRMAAIPARRDHAPTDLIPPRAIEASPRPVVAPAPTAPRRSDDEPPPVAAPSSKTLGTIPVPLPLAELLPHGALARGTALTVTGAGSVLVGIVAAATAAGHHVAIIGQPKFGCSPSTNRAVTYRRSPSSRVVVTVSRSLRFVSTVSILL